ncbi:MAG: type IV pilin protein [Rubrivivax sp.]|nr:type IV pilin protein [Rubrivivax sp.]
MNRALARTASRTPVHGFTLVEMLIALVIIGILAAVALPSFNDSVRKSRRADAFTVFAALQQAQERWRGNNASYSDTLANTAAAGSPPNGLGVAATSSAGYYSIALSGVSGSAYTATATAVSGKSQAADGNCVRLRVRMAGGNIFYGSASATGEFDESSGNRCWSR